jgi:hypothetical protein
MESKMVDGVAGLATLSSCKQDVRCWRASPDGLSLRTSWRQSCICTAVPKASVRHAAVQALLGRIPRDSPKARARRGAPVRGLVGLPWPGPPAQLREARVLGAGQVVLRARQGLAVGRVVLQVQQALPAGQARRGPPALERRASASSFSRTRKRGRREPSPCCRPLWDRCSSSTAMQWPRSASAI